MQKKTIKKVLNKKFNDWCYSIADEEVRNLVKNNTIITGGAIASMLLGEEVKDFDIYFRDKQTALAVAKYYVDKFKDKNKETSVKVEEKDNRIKIIVKSNGVASENNEMLEEPFEDVYDVLEEADKIDSAELENIPDPQEQKEKYRPIFLSSNAITLSNKIQCIIRFYGEPEEIHSSYDFIHATNYWTSWDNDVVTSVEALESLMSKHLKYMGSKYPLCSIIRTRKFINRGWHINAGQYLKMCLQLNELDLKDIDVLEDQLIGVDSAYFTQLIDSIRNRQEKDDRFELNNAYIISIIDKIF